MTQKAETLLNWKINIRPGACLCSQTVQPENVSKLLAKGCKIYVVGDTKQHGATYCSANLVSLRRITDGWLAEIIGGEKIVLADRNQLRVYTSESFIGVRHPINPDKLTDISEFKITEIQPGVQRLPKRPFSWRTDGLPRPRFVRWPWPNF